MIIMRMRGGLGNQLFQYAAGYALSKKYCVKLKLDTYTYETVKYRKLELDKFKTNCKIASRDEISRYIPNKKLIRGIHKKLYYIGNQKVYAQPYYGFDSRFFDLPSDIYLSGYFQSYKYFESVDKELRSFFQPIAESKDQNQYLQEEIQKCNSVGIHVRRGDYFADRKAISFFTKIGMSYYTEAIDYIKSCVKMPKFYIFSNDISWCKEIFKNLSDMKFISHNNEENSYWDLILMSGCKHNIISNSTFSWWGAWLNDYNKKVVITPKNWFKRQLNLFNNIYPLRWYTMNDLIPEDWIRL